MQPDRPLLILICGPYTSGTGGDAAKIAAPVFKTYQYPVAHRLLERCDAVLRIPGESRGADLDVERARGLGLSIYHHVDEIPLRLITPLPQ
jgi:hypothetical protein